MSARCFDNYISLSLPEAFLEYFFLEYMNHQALVLTHEGASPVEKLPYLGVMLAPTPVLEFYGRCATRNPPCHKNDAVFYW